MEVQKLVLATNKGAESPGAKTAHRSAQYRKGTGSGVFQPQRAPAGMEESQNAIIEYMLVIKPTEHGYNNGRSSVLRVESKEEVEGWLADINSQMKVSRCPSLAEDSFI